jgi:hypothetical protein
MSSSRSSAPSTAKRRNSGLPCAVKNRGRSSPTSKSGCVSSEPFSRQITIPQRPSTTLNRWAAFHPLPGRWPRQASQVHGRADCAKPVVAMTDYDRRTIIQFQSGATSKSGPAFCLQKVGQGAMTERIFHAASPGGVTGLASRNTCESLSKLRHNCTR